MNLKKWDIYWATFCEPEMATGYSTRPCIIVSNDGMNGNDKVMQCLVVPMTTNHKHDHLITRVPFEVGNRCSTAMCDNIRTIAKKDLREKMGIVPIEKRNEVIQGIVSGMSLNESVAKYQKETNSHNERPAYRDENQKYRSAQASFRNEQQKYHRENRFHGHY